MTDPLNPEMVLFNAAIELPLAERAAFLSKACAGDDGLLQRLQSLLASHDAAGAFLSHEDFATTSADVHAGDASTAVIPPTSKAGDVIGRYKLLQQIGEGGCGVVYMAEQTEPVRRQVALKVIKLGMDTKSVIARFEAERQALALMDHPNIAKVLDGGATEQGRPYFVMELVRGIKITEFCDQNNLTTRERLALFVQVCQAIQHAHQKGVIHRDIKPSNILVTLNDGVPLPKVIDFGIAKATQQRLTDKTYFTAFEQFIGTPAYMSPEQAEMNALGVDTRSDVYSLGVLLYELLTGKTPFTQQELLKAGMDEIRRIIREVEPMRPSTRLSTMVAGELTTTAGHRRITPPKLIQTVSGELDWIVMKALEKDRTRRYETAVGFARDIERYLADEPVTACPPSKLYQLQKLTRRHKFLFGSVAAVLAALMIGLGFSCYLYIQEKQALRLAAEAEHKAQSEAIRSSQVAQFLGNMLQGVSPDQAQGKDTTLLKEILEKSLISIGSELTNEPTVVVGLRNTIGQVFMNLGEYKRAEVVYREALALSRQELGENNIYTAHTLMLLALALSNQQKLEQAEALLNEAITICVKLGNEDEWLWDCGNLANVLTSQGQLGKAENMRKQGLATAEKLFGKDGLRTGYALSGLASVLEQQHKYGESEAMYRESLAIQKKRLPDDDHKIDTALANLAGVLAMEGKLAEAEAIFRDVLNRRRKIYSDDHIVIINTLLSLEGVLTRENKLIETRKLLDDIVTPALVKNPHSATLLHFRAEFFAQQGLWKQAIPDELSAMNLNPEKFTYYLGYATLLAATADWKGYRHHCDDYLDRYGDTKDRTRAHWLVRSCMLAPIDEPHRQLLDRLADLQLSGGKSSAYYADDENCKGTVEYNAGHFESARNWLSNSIVDRVGTNQDDTLGQLGNWSLLAMCQKHLNEDSQAKIALANADGLAAKMPKLTDGNIGGNWKYWVLNMHLYNEAKILFDGGVDTNAISR